MKHEDEIPWRIHRPINRIRTIQSGSPDNYLDGSVLTKHGIVEVYAQGYTDPDGKVQSFHFSKLEYVYGRRVYTRKWNCRLKERGLVIRARRFAEEINERFGR